MNTPLRLQTLLAAGIAAGALSLSHGAAAYESGWYWGIGGSGTAVDDADNTSTQPGTAGSTEVSCLLDIIPVLGPIVGNIICLLPTESPTPGTPPIPQQTQFTFSNGFGINGSFGYSFESGMRPEFEIGYMANDIDSFTLQSGFSDMDGNPVAPGTPAPGFTDGNVEALRLGLNAWYDIPTGTLVWPYFGGGIGMQNSTYTLNSSGGTSTDDSDTTFSYQLGAGIGFEVATDWIVSADYRYIASDEPELRGGAAGSGTTATEYTAQTVGLSIKHIFAPTLGPDSDGDGVTDRRDRCPNTPKDVQVDAEGCPLDTDGDGVADYLDKCPGTAAGIAVNAEGCEIDSDGDGVVDSKDQCPGTPAKVQVNPQGCPLDSDGDGVPDYLDQCSNTPPGVMVNAHGCAASDKDGDGVPDELDRCKDTPKGIEVGADGCPLDSDGDGIPDYLDECPHSPPGAKVLPDGCALIGDCRKPRAGEQVDANGCALDNRFILRGVKFEFDSDRLLPESKAILIDVAKTLDAYPNVKVDVEGHTDNIGTDAYNLGLSERRAIAVKVYLSDRGVKAERMTPVPYGESKPIDNNDTEAGREENRRVEFKVN